ncbi:hypothetical protein DMN91_002493 [Ooceraea biroi]|uniref:Uncharacterized protein n=1 Tax=Ooceraea biroi TaxID=2015173 RepID=A0A3L8DVD9_OOCBI|nr:hypothetical protein DMN91_002493 [Ooceraea biroi]
MDRKEKEEKEEEDRRRQLVTWSTYLAGSSYLGFRGFAASRLVITVVVIGPETAVALVQLPCPAIFRPVLLKPGDSLRHIRHLPRPRALCSCFSAKTVNVLGTLQAEVRFAIAFHGICPIRPTPGSSYNVTSCCGTAGDDIGFSHRERIYQRELISRNRLNAKRPCGHSDNNPIYVIREEKPSGTANKQTPFYRRAASDTIFIRIEMQRQKWGSLHPETTPEQSNEQNPLIDRPEVAVLASK